MIDHLAIQLNIPSSHVFANVILFDEAGNYIGFDENRPTSKTGGKGLVIQKLKEEKGYTKVMMIGDGITDLETKPHADIVVGFGGNVIREKLRTNADWFITDFQEVINAL